MLPKDLKRPVDDLTNPSNKILVTVLIMAVMFITGTFYEINAGRLQDCKENHAEDLRKINHLEDKYDSLVSYTNRINDDRDKAENIELNQRTRLQDSIKLVLQNEIKNALRKR